MAERRMFAITVVDSDAFLDMPLSTQALYFHLSMRADDDGFINNPKKIQRTIGATDGDAAMLIARKFIIPFDTGVVVIKHWRINNFLRKDRYHETVYQEEKEQLSIKDNGAYSLKKEECLPVGIPLVNHRSTENSIDKYSKDKSSKVETTSSREEENNNKSIKTSSSTVTREVPTRHVRTQNEHEEAQAFMDRFNSIEGVLPCSRLHATREVLINTLFSVFEPDEIERAFQNLSNSDFLRGKVAGANGKPFQTTFDWFITLNNFTKIVEGNYLDRTASDQEEDSEPTPEMYLNQKGVN